jgi:hypothetical protein
LSSRRFHGVVNLFQSTCVTSLVLEASDRFKDSMAMTSTLECWSVEGRAWKLPDYHQQRLSDSGKGVATATRRRIARRQ